MSIRIATFNCRNTVDRWKERRPLLVDQLVELRPDVIGLQELRHLPSFQGRQIANRAGRQAATAYWLHTTYKTGLYWFWEGIGILSHLPIVERDALKLAGGNRVANVVRVRLPSGGVLDFYNCHLGAPGAAHGAQAERVLEWMRMRPGVPQVLVGDFNVTPRNPIYQLITQTLRSAYADVHGREPEKTVPTPLRREGPKPTAPKVLDYLFVNEQVRVHDAAVAFDRIGADPHLCASDHYGLAATISLLGPP